MSRPRPSSRTRAARRNPPAPRAAYAEVLRTARSVGRELDPTGRAAVLLAGSWARGDAHLASDIDLWVVGTRSRKRLRVLERAGRMVCVSFMTPASARREFRNPGRLDGAVPGWRSARILVDPGRAAARLQAEARRFRWPTLRHARDRYVAEQLVGWAEEVTKLLRALDTGTRETAAVQRNLLANAMAPLRALSLEQLGDSENGLWERTGRWAGARFATAQRAALGTDGGSFRKSCEAALRLYALTAEAHLARLTDEQRRVVTMTCRQAGFPIEGPNDPGR